MFDWSVRVGVTNLWTWRAQVAKQSNSLTPLSPTNTHVPHTIYIDTHAEIGIKNKQIMGELFTYPHVHACKHVEAFMDTYKCGGYMHTQKKSRRAEACACMTVVQ